MSATEFSCITEPKFEELRFLWVIEDIDLLSEHIKNRISTPYLSSPETDSGQWQLSLFESTTDDDQTFLSLSLFYTGLSDVNAKATVFTIDESGQVRNKHRIPARPFSRYRGSFALHKFIRRSDLECSTCQSLAIGDLVICGVVTIIDGYVSAPGTCNSVEANVPRCQLSKDLAWLLDSGNYTDVTVKVGGGTYSVHKAILASRSPVFRAMLSAEMLEAHEDEITIADMDYDVFGSVLRFMYTGHTGKLDGMAAPLLAAAAKYGLQQLQGMCEKALIEGMNIENAAISLILADQHDAALLRQGAIAFISAHANEVVKTPGWDELMAHRSELVYDAFRALPAGYSPTEPAAKKRRTL